MPRQKSWRTRGDRYGLYEDPYGHRWSIATHIKDLSSAEIEEAGSTAMASGEMCASQAQAQAGT